MSFTEVRFPNDIAYGSSGGPEFSTNVVTVASGMEQRNMNWLHARAVYNVAHGVRTKAQLAELIAFFRSVKGRAVGFRFKDWSDYKTTAETIGTGDGSETEFQLVKTYTNTDQSYSRTITKPVSGTVKIYIDDVEVESGFVVDTTTGKVTFDTAPATNEVITADFEFDVPVRFDSDKLELSLDSVNAGSVKEVRLVEVRV